MSSLEFSWASVLQAHSLSKLQLSHKHELLTSLHINIFMLTNKSNVSLSFFVFHSREDNEFADVTLFCEDNKQNEAHRIML